MAWQGFEFPIWSKSSGALAEIKKPGLYAFEFSVSLSQTWTGKKATAFGWEAKVERIVDNAAGTASTAYVRLGPAQRELGQVNEAKLSPLQLNALLGAGFLLVASAFLVSVRYVFDSPTATLAIFVVLGLVTFFVYYKFVKKK